MHVLHTFFGRFQRGCELGAYHKYGPRINTDMTCQSVPSCESSLYGNRCPARHPCSRPTFSQTRTKDTRASHGTEYSLTLLYAPRITDGLRTTDSQPLGRRGRVRDHAYARSRPALHRYALARRYLDVCVSPFDSVHLHRHGEPSNRIHLACT